ncbi:MAG TPA: hypothetical protein DEF18_07155 [Muricauda sp.]|uniref:Uncharacterized protein n=1 Tax=Flagellimonas aurea TaxID=2915619 RepID=A0ABS3G9C2_9FLAO|nr:DUF6452 family protein [Allomuricauda aurea]MAO18298.1 hypothetical protein [Allomuricauda sp.]MBO0355990.1 hypothetical protein [Allomuricauda aurea]UBZ13029.1 hypothetical protein LDL77_14205 [Allomuricauda aquimarina]HBU77865.1 hypothetical protein [Allomuricauda sp.]|tara:strand:- start:948 stop:1466 length:519 start_codon:yes stop_codon:yes gene_type:complete
MKKIIPILLIVSVLFYVSSCEKDDICVDGDTPLMVIGFFDFADTTLVKNVPSIRIRNIDIDSILTNSSFSDRSESPDSLQVPLRSTATTTMYQIISESADDEETELETGNIDTLTISYELGEAFVSRACGFVTNYNNISVTLTEGAENWIQDIKVVQPNVENTNTIHVKIFH